jgi:hypothetical protein
MEIWSKTQKPLTKYLQLHVHSIVVVRKMINNQTFGIVLPTPWSMWAKNNGLVSKIQHLHLLSGLLIQFSCWRIYPDVSWTLHCVSIITPSSHPQHSHIQQPCTFKHMCCLDEWSQATIYITHYWQLSYKSITSHWSDLFYIKGCIVTGVTTFETIVGRKHLLYQ